MSFLGTVSAIVRKDLLNEVRSKEMLIAMLLFALLVLVIFSFALFPGSATTREVAPGALWVAFTFAGVLGLNRSFLQEYENDCLLGLRLAPGDPSTIYAGKMIGNVAFMLMMEAIILPIFAIFFNFPLFSHLPRLAPVLLLSTVGFAAVGTLLSAMATATRMREILLPILLFPIVVPVILAAVKVTGKIFAGRTLAEVAPWLKLLLAYDTVFLVVSFLIFAPIIEE